MTTPKGPFRLVSVNTAPDRARRVIGRVADLLRDRYIIVHEANCESMSPACNRDRLTEQKSRMSGRP